MRAAGRRLRRGPGRGLAGRRGRLLRLDARRAGRRCCRRQQARAVTLRYGVTPEGNFEGATILRVVRRRSTRSRASSARTPARCWPRRARRSTPRAPSAPRRRATTRWWPPGTAWRSPRSPTPACSSGARTTWTRRRGTAAFVLDAPGRGRAPAAGAHAGPGRATSGSSTTTPTSATACCASTRRPSSRAGSPPRGSSPTAWSSCSPTPRAAASSTPAPTARRWSPAPASWRTTRRRRATPRPPTCCCAWPTLTGDAGLEERALGALRLVRDDMARFPQAFGTALVALDHHLSEPREIAIVGPRDDPRTRALVAAARAARGPYDALAAGDPDDAAAPPPRRCWRPAPGGRVPGRLRVPAFRLPGARRDSPGAHGRALPVAFRAGQPTEGARVSRAGIRRAALALTRDGGGGRRRAGAGSRWRASKPAAVRPLSAKANELAFNVTKLKAPAGPRAAGADEQLGPGPQRRAPRAQARQAPAREDRRAEGKKSVVSFAGPAPGQVHASTRSVFGHEAGGHEGHPDGREAHGLIPGRGGRERGPAAILRRRWRTCLSSRR